MDEKPKATFGHRPKVRTKFLQIRVSPDEKKEIKDKAGSAGLSLTDFMLEATARTRTWTIQDRAIQEEKIRQIARIGNNLNQVARIINQQKVVHQELELLRVLQGIENEVRRALGSTADAY